MNQERQTYNKKTELSLSAIMFFSPLIQNQINKKTNIPQTDINFIKWFIKLGYLNIILLLLAIWLQIIYYLKQNILIQKLSLLVTIILAWFLVLGVILVIIDRPITKLETKNTTNKKNNKLEIILSYIPLYNIYLRYNKHDFENPDIILKESIIRRSIFSMIFLLFQNQNISWIFLTIILIRLITLINDLDRWDNIKKIINKFFIKNPEEMRWYIVWVIITIFNKKTLQENIKTQTQEFWLILKIEYKHILLQYTIFFILWIYLIYHGINKGNTAIVAPILFIFSRYLIMIIKWKRTTQIPILKEISGLFFNKKLLWK